MSITYNAMYALSFVCVQLNGGGAPPHAMVSPNPLDSEAFDFASGLALESN